MAPSPRQGLTEYAVVLVLLALAAAGGVAAFREPIRALFGAPPAPAQRAAPAPPR